MNKLLKTWIVDEIGAKHGGKVVKHIVLRKVIPIHLGEEGDTLADFHHVDGSAKEFTCHLV